jgi:hypothetical protein
MSVGFTNGQMIHADPTYIETNDAKGQRGFVSTDQTMTIVANLNVANPNTFNLVISRNGQADTHLAAPANQLEEIVVEWVTHHSLQKNIAAVHN